jgi:ATP-binding cassette, subfamily F, member 3
MLRVSALQKSFGGEVVLRDVSFTIAPGERVGLVGANGAGKSTLLGIIAGLIEPDAGSVWLDPSDRVAYLPQYPADFLYLSVREALLRAQGDLPALEAGMRELEQSMADAEGDDGLETLLTEYTALRERFEALGGYTAEARLERVVDGLSLGVVDLDAPVASLSGGNKTKLSLARLLLSGASILLLDEPTNYLDLPALLWLERFVAESDASYVVVSHDRRFLDRTVNAILELDADTGSVRRWAGDYSAYDAAKRLEAQKELEAYLGQQAEIARIEADIRQTKEQARGTEQRVKSGSGMDHTRRIAKKVARKAKVRERKLDRMLDEDTIDKPKAGWGLHLADLGLDPVADNRIIVEARDLTAGYDGREVLHGVDLEIRGRDRVALVGANGSGKSTLVRCITGAIPFDGSLRLGPSVRLGLLSQETEGFDLDTTVLDTFRANTQMHESEARTYLHRFLFQGDAVFKPVRVLSYGQRAKLALAALILTGANFLVLDEPTSHMDMPALEAIEEALDAYVGPLLLVSHDRAFMEALEITRVLVLDSGRLCEVESIESYEEALRAERRIQA